MANRSNLATFTITLLLFFTGGCASLGTPSTQELAFEPRGPGAVFDTIEDAAVDALAHAHLRARAEHKQDRMYGGKIRVVRGGYTYGELVVGPRTQPPVLYTRLRAHDVARFHVYPRLTDARANRRNERISLYDRRVVNERDPAHRPLFVLTPRLSVLVYRAHAHGSTEIASLKPMPVKEQLASQ